MFADYGQCETWLITAYSESQATTPQPSVVAREPNRAGARRSLLWLELPPSRNASKFDARLAAAHERVEDPAIASDAAALEEALRELADAQHESHDLYARWAELSEKAG